MGMAGEVSETYGNVTWKVFAIYGILLLQMQEQQYIGNMKYTILKLLTENSFINKRDGVGPVFNRPSNKIASPHCQKKKLCDM